MNTTASDVERANPISCVTTTIVMPSAPSSAMSARIPLTNSGSSAEVASSKNITCGDIASALAIATRCCCPPDSVPGPGSEPLELARRQRDVVQHGAVREQVEVLEHHADALPQSIGVVGKHR